MSHWFEEGGYTCNVVRQGFSESKNKGTPYFFLEVEFLSAKGPNQMPAKAGTREIVWYITDATVEFVIEKLAKLGFTGKFAQLDPSVEGHHSFVDQEIDVFCQHDGEYDKFDLSRDFGTSEVAGLSAKLDKMFGKQITAAAKKGGGAKSTAAKKADAKSEADAVGAASVTPGDDEVPF